MDNIQKMIVKHLLSSHYYDFMFDARHTKHGDQESIINFCEIVKREIKGKENVDIEVDDVKTKWHNMRRKFVDINLKKFRRQKISAAHEDFYVYLIFLEDYISHKNAPVFKSLNKKEIQQSVYDLLTGHTFEEPREQFEEVKEADNIDDNSDDFDLQDYPDLGHIFHDNSHQSQDLAAPEVDEIYEEVHEQAATYKNTESTEETAELEILDGYEEVVIMNLVSHANENEIPSTSQEQPTQTQFLFQEPIVKKKDIDRQADKQFLSENKLQKINLAMNVSIETSVNHNLVQSCIDTVHRHEFQLSSVRLHNEKLNLKIKSDLIKEAVNIIYSALMESTSVPLRTIRFHIIINAVNDFIKSVFHIPITK
ncbi:uncharacterized protein LOC103315784 [Nasonia vitripennis]|uniref:MADF domain-containing protein n=1 Tax=Nasonia vitripennis TaxID=7425 RepID=A0A7M7M2F6_NASVI|nr:uncharacterized protein LOC103315784 [Nasonia vitripennis]XP_016842966.1 uncharacterized protein LOC103315784 [Nasonia vitripennis]XP_031781076.1 uncharacterized protein LOC103315784 [Nasonia vitripennis]